LYRQRLQIIFIEVRPKIIENNSIYGLLDEKKIFEFKRSLEPSDLRKIMFHYAHNIRIDDLCNDKLWTYMNSVWE